MVSKKSSSKKEEAFSVRGEDLLKKFKELIKEGNIRKITILNKDFVRHDFIIDDLNVNTGYFYSGQDFTTAIASRELGEFEYYCSLHPTTMRGKLIISENK